MANVREYVEKGNDARTNLSVKRLGDYIERKVAIKRTREDLAFLDLAECNEWEGETWHFYLEYRRSDMSDALIEGLAASISANNDDWSIKRTGMDYKLTKNMIEYDESDGYMSKHNYGCELDSATVQGWLDCEGCMASAEYWYKGDFHIECLCDQETKDQRKRDEEEGEEEQ